MVQGLWVECSLVILVLGERDVFRGRTRAMMFCVVSGKGWGSP